jgi:hypothetical protein
MTDHSQSTSSTFPSVSASVKANSGRLATAAVVALAMITLMWALTEVSRLPETQKSELFVVLAQAYP